MQNIQERLLRREGQAHESDDSTASPQTAGMSRHERLKLLEIICYPWTVIHNVLEGHQMMEFLEFLLETNLPPLNFRLGVPLLQPDWTKHWELQQTAPAKSPRWKWKALEPLHKTYLFGHEYYIYISDQASFHLHIPLALGSLSGNNLERNVYLAAVLKLDLRTGS